MKLSRVEKTLGIVCAVTGPVIVVSGAVLLGLGIGEYSISKSSSPTTSAVINIACGSALAVCGTILTALAPITIIHSKKHKTQAQQYRGQAYMSMPSLQCQALIHMQVLA